MEIKIPSTGNPCTKCKERDGNPLHNGFCNVCYSNMLCGEPKKEIVNVSQPSIWEERAVGIFIGIFIVIGILFLSKISSNEITDQDPCDGSNRSVCP